MYVYVVVLYLTMNLIVYVYVYIYVYMLCIHVMCMSIYMFMSTSMSCGVCVCVYIYMYMYIYIRIFTCMYVCMYVCIYIHTEREREIQCMFTDRILRQRPIHVHMHMNTRIHALCVYREDPATASHPLLRQQDVVEALLSAGAQAGDADNDGYTGVYVCMYVHVHDMFQ